MKLKTLINKALKGHPIPANMTPKGGVAIVFTDEDDMVYALKADMDEERFQDICDHIRVHGVKKMLASKLV
jgi:hypothetical protein